MRLIFDLSYVGGIFTRLIEVPKKIPSKIPSVTTGCYRTLLDANLVEVAGVEPASVSSLPSALHA